MFADTSLRRNAGDVRVRIKHAAAQRSRASSARALMAAELRGDFFCIAHLD
jgi:hypothetical protein